MLSSFSLITRNNADHVFIYFFCIFLEFFGLNLINHSIEKKYQNKKKQRKKEEEEKIPIHGFSLRHYPLRHYVFY